MPALFNRITLSVFIVCLLLTSIVGAHPGEPEPVFTARQLERRQEGIRKRHSLASNCNSAIAAYEARRKAKRNMIAERTKGQGHGHKPSQWPKPLSTTNHPCIESSTSTTSATSSAISPTYSSIQNVGLLPYYEWNGGIDNYFQTSCVLTPEAEEGPYYIVRDTPLRPLGRFSRRHSRSTRN